MKRYVLTFLFTPDMNHVWLIKKEKPEWQKGCLNGIGGKIEKNELPIEAALRELREEADVLIEPNEITHFCTMEGDDGHVGSFEVVCFTGVTDKQFQTNESERVYKIRCQFIKGIPHIANVPMLLEAAIYRLSQGTSKFKHMVMKYIN